MSDYLLTTRGNAAQNEREALAQPMQVYPIDVSPHKELPKNTKLTAEHYVEVLAVTRDERRGIYGLDLRSDLGGVCFMRVSPKIAKWAIDFYKVVVGDSSLLPENQARLLFDTPVFVHELDLFDTGLTGGQVEIITHEDVFPCQ